MITVQEAAKRLRLHPKTVLRYIHEGKLQATKVGKAYRVELDTGKPVCTVTIDHPNVTATGSIEEMIDFLRRLSDDDA